MTKVILNDMEVKNVLEVIIGTDGSQIKQLELVDGRPVIDGEGVKVSIITLDCFKDDIVIDIKTSNKEG